MHGWSWLLGLSLVRGPLHVALLAGGVTALVGLVVLRRFPPRPAWLYLPPAYLVCPQATPG